MMSENAMRRVIVNLPSEQVEFLLSVAAKEHIPVVDILRRAIKSEQFFVENENSNRKVLIEDGCRIREIIRR
jgi:hypothetical protein